MLGERLNGNQLKLIAVITMVIDHSGYLLGAYNGFPHLVGDGGAERLLQLCMILRMIGRIAFPIFAFLLMEGFTYTRNRKKYLMRMGIFALISEAAFDFMISRTLWDPEAQNVFFTFFIALSVLAAWEYVEQRYTAYTQVALSMAVILLGCAAAWALRTDYSFYGIVLIAIYKRFRLNPKAMCVIGFIWQINTSYMFWNMLGILASFLLIYCYNGKQGKRKFGYLFYWFYPVHMVMLAGIFWMIAVI